MAGDWIKMRTSLLTNPRVNGIARILEDDRNVGRALSTGFNGCMSEIVTRNVMRHVTVSSLLIVWGAANEHTRDGVFRNADLSDIDDMVGIPGFGEAMEAVGWASYDADSCTVTLPNFNEYNTSGHDRTAQAKTAAERQREYRERKKSQESDVTRDVTSDVTRNRREEKSREEEEDVNILVDSPADAGPSADGAAAMAACPVDQLVALYHEVLPELPRCRLMSDARRKALQRRWRWVLSSRLPDGSRRATTPADAMDWFRRYFDRARSSDFLMGRTARGAGHEGWQCDLDFLLGDKGMKVVIEKTEVAA